MISLWAIWFATALTEPAGLFACPMHSGIAAAAADGEASADAGPAVAHHHATDAAQAATDATSQAPERSDHSCCTCIGQCCTMAPAMLPDAPFVLPLGLSRQAQMRAHAPPSRVRQAVDHQLPFANAPPRATLS